MKDSLRPEKAFTHGLRYHRLGKRVPACRIQTLPHSASPWHETPEQIQDALLRFEERQRLLDIVRETMARTLTTVEQRAIRLYYFHGLSYREAAAASGVNPATVYRAVQRALRKLRREFARDT